jgi:hypothetical protein
MTIDFAIENGRNVKAGEIYGYFVQTFVMSAISMGATKGIGAYFDQFKATGLRELGRAVAHGTFNGAMRYAQGGKFEHGFMSGFVSSLGGSYMQSNDGNMSLGAKVTMSAVIGGTAEKLGGGKFANGAVTGAYVMMFNHLGGGKRSRIPQYDELPPVNNTKNWEYANVEGVDYLFFDNQWIELPVNDYNYKGKDPDPLGVGEIEATIPRENFAIYNHLKSKEMMWGSLSGIGLDGISGSGFTIINALKSGYKFNPVNFTIGYTLGGISSYYNTFRSMHQHDLRVDELRRKSPNL